MDNNEGAQSASGAIADASVLALNGASRTKADAYLELQMEEMRQRNPYELSHLRLRRFGDWAKALLEISVGLLVLALVAGISLMVWNAAHSEGLIVESFNVPPDMAAKGLTGQVIAGQLTAKLTQLQADTDSNRAPRSYSNDWGDDIKVEIPDTGVSIGEAYRFLRRWLGHETHVGGDMWRTSAGIVIAARVNGGGDTLAGTEADLDSLIQKTAEEIFNRTQPYRYAVYLQRRGRATEADVIRRTLAQTGDANESAWALFAMAVNQMNDGSPAEQRRLLQLAVPHGPALAAGNLGSLEDWLGHPELARSYAEQADARMREGGGDINPDARAFIASVFIANRLRYQSDYRAAAQEMEKRFGGRARSVANPAYLLAYVQLLDHDRAAARGTMQRAAAEWTSNGNLGPGSNIRARFETRMAMARDGEDWAGAISLARDMDAALRAYPGWAALVLTADDPGTAIAEARLEKFAEAERRLSNMPADCYPCLIARATVADMQGQVARSDSWFARAVASNPSIATAETRWGEALLGRKSPDAAIEKFKAASKKAPHFADPLQGWGEALMAKNQSHLALEKFKEAEKYAPNWGRLHLKWGEALYYAGKTDEARAQIARARQLDLTPSEKSELARLGHV